MATELDKELVEQLEKSGALSAELMDRLMAANDSDDITNFGVEQFHVLEGFNPATAFVAHRIISDWKARKGIVTVTDEPTMPKKPPYLNTPEDYDAHDPGQFWTSPTGQMIRWDGKGRNLPKSDPRRWGQPHRVIAVKHFEAFGAVIPDRADAEKALKSGMDWFHHGYRCWIGAGGKPYASVPRDVKDKVKAARERFYQFDEVGQLMPA